MLHTRNSQIVKDWCVSQSMAGYNGFRVEVPGCPQLYVYNMQPQFVAVKFSSKPSELVLQRIRTLPGIRWNQQEQRWHLPGCGNKQLAQNPAYVSRQLCAVWYFIAWLMTDYGKQLRPHGPGIAGIITATDTNGTMVRFES